MVENNWYVIAQMYVDVGGSTFYRIYFIMFYYFGVLVGLNIVVAFAIDMYTAVCRLDKQRLENEEHLYRISLMRYSDFQAAITKEPNKQDIKIALDIKAGHIVDVCNRKFPGRLGALETAKIRPFITGMILGQDPGANEL